MPRTDGIELLNRLNEGDLAQAPSEYLTTVREQVSTALEELVEVGARIRPLLVEKQRVGWVRGVHLTERRALKRWITDEVEFIELLLGLVTTLSVEEIRGLTLVEVRSLGRIINAMTDADLKLYGYLSALAIPASPSRSDRLLRPHRADDPMAFISWPFVIRRDQLPWIAPTLGGKC